MVTFHPSPLAEKLRAAERCQRADDFRRFFCRIRPDPDIHLAWPFVRRERVPDPSIILPPRPPLSPALRHRTVRATINYRRALARARAKNHGGNYRGGVLVRTLNDRRGRTCASRPAVASSPQDKHPFFTFDVLPPTPAPRSRSRWKGTLLKTFLARETKSERYVRALTRCAAR